MARGASQVIVSLAGAYVVDLINKEVDNPTIGRLLGVAAQEEALKETLQPIVTNLIRDISAPLFGNADGAATASAVQHRAGADRTR